jgi:hypothetical protein
MQNSKFIFSPKTLLSWSTVFWMSLLSTLGVVHAQSGSFIIPTIRANNGTDFAFWDEFHWASEGSSSNYNFPNPPAALFGEDGKDINGNPTNMYDPDDGNPATPLVPRAHLIQNGDRNAFITSTGAIYSHSGVTKFELPYRALTTATGEATNVIFQTKTGGNRLNVNSVRLTYEVGGTTHSVLPVFRGLDDPQTGAFSERVVCAFQWNLTGLNVRDFKIIFEAPGIAMPLWEAQLDVVVGKPFHQELGYLLVSRTRPLTNFGNVGSVKKDLDLDMDGRYFFEDDELRLYGTPTLDWRTTGWLYNGVTQRTSDFMVVFPASDITVTGLFAPTKYSAWRRVMFYHVNPILGTLDDYLNDEISGPNVDHDEDGLTNAGEYAFGGDPYDPDKARTRPRMLLVDVGGVTYPAIRYRTNGLLPNTGGDVIQTVRLSANDGAFQSNSEASVTLLVSRELQADGSELVTERALQPFSSFTSVDMDVAWSVGGTSGRPQGVGPLTIETGATLAEARAGSTYSQPIVASGGIEPYVWAKTSGDFPAGITMAADGTLNGMPTAGGDATFTLQVTDARGTSQSRAFTIKVKPFEINTESIAYKANAAFVQTLTVAGGTAPYTWTVVEGALPSSVTVSAQGVISGTVATEGSYPFTVQVSDSTSYVTTKQLTLLIFAVEITTPAILDPAIQGAAYSKTLAGLGTGTLTWSSQPGSVLPGGLNINSTGVLSGIPTTAGVFNFTINMKDAENQTASKVFTLEVLNITPVPVVNPPNFAPATVGASVNYAVTATNGATQFAMSGLPKGMSYDSAAGTISGSTGLAGVYLVQIRASNATGSSRTINAPLIIQALPSAQVGNFTGIISRDSTANGNLGSVFTLTTTTTGAFTVKVKSGSATQSAKGFLNGGANQVNVSVGGNTLTLSLATNGKITGTHGAATVQGWRQVWDKKFNPASSYEGYYSAALKVIDTENLEIPQGIGYTTFTVASAGSLKITGKTADGQTITSATNLGPNGEIAVYATLYGNKGTLVGVWEVDADGLFINNDIEGELTWSKPETKGRAYVAPFGPVALNVEGGYLGVSPKSAAVLGLPAYGAINLEFEAGGIDQSATDANVMGAVLNENYTVSFPTGVTNDAKVALKVNKGSGAVSGSFILTETAPALVRKGVKFQGQVVRLSNADTKVVGYFLLPQIPAAGEKPTTSPILSGSFFITQ